MSSDLKTYRADNLTSMSWTALFKDLIQGLKMWRIWTALSWQEFKSTYRRSIFGILWVMGAFAGFVFVKLIVFSSLITSDDMKAYNSFLTIGIYLWMYFVLVVNTASTTFISSSGWLRSEALPFSLYVYKSVMRELYNFGLTSIVVVAAILYIGFKPSPQSLYAIPAVIFYVINAVWIKFFFGIIGARFRDIGHFVNAVTLPMMFLTPIFWMPEQMPNLMKYLWWNPFYHYLEVFRAPIVSGVFPLQSWIYVLVLFLFGWMATIFTYARFSQRVVFWL